MIRVICRQNEAVLVQETLPDDAASAEFPCWIDLAAPTGAEMAAVSGCYDIDFRTRAGNVVEEAKYLYIQLATVSPREEEEPQICRVTVILGDNFLVTVRQEEACLAADLAIQRLQRRPEWALSAKSLLRILLQATNDHAERTVEQISGNLERTTTTHIGQISTGYSADGKELGVTELTEATLDLNDQEELVSRCLECQLALARAARHLSTEVDDEAEPELQSLVNELIADVAGVKEHFAFEHDRIRYLQGAVTNILNIKQNQIVKVFTIITAVFLPPTLVATFYGMNFAVMPELSWEHGFIYSIALTLAGALLPLVYIKRKGWLR
jgi:magnesium transporter